MCFLLKHKSGECQKNSMLEYNLQPSRNIAVKKGPEEELCRRRRRTRSESKMRVQSTLLITIQMVFPKRPAWWYILDTYSCLVYMPQIYCQAIISVINILPMISSYRCNNIFILCVKLLHAQKMKYDLIQLTQ